MQDSNYRNKTVARILGDAFIGDPIFSYISSKEEFPVFFWDVVTPFFRRDNIVLSQDRSAAMIYQLSTSKSPTFFCKGIKATTQILIKYGICSYLKSFQVFGLMHSNHVKYRHCYLFAIGTKKEKQGVGVGSILMAQIKEISDKQRIPIYLESSNPRNLTFYQRHGFKVKRQIPVKKSVKIWLMQRNPK